MKRIGLLVLVAMATGLVPAHAATGFSSSAIPRLFTSMAQSPTLADPSIILIDRSTGEVVYENDSVSPRKPASVMKVLSATAALEYLDPEKQYKTRVFLGVKPGSIVFDGELDPWMTSSHKDAVADHRAWIGYLAGKAIAAIKEQSDSPIRKISIKYEGLYAADVIGIRSYFRSKGIITGATQVSSRQIVALSGAEIAETTSPTISTMVEFALLWSDNLLAERLARLAAKSAGYTLDDIGVSNTFHTMLINFNVDNSDLRVHDGSGLSKSNRVTAKLIADLLVTLRGNEKFAALYAGLPVGGVSGTLENRFIKTAPQAVGLVRAKTGTLNGTVSLAGYIESGEHEYIFVVIADQIPKGHTAATRARNALDRILGKIAAPLIMPVQIPASQETVSDPTLTI